MSQSNILIFNALITAVKTGLGFVIALFSIRLLIRELGFVDYGLLTALGASGFFVSMLTSGLNIAASRHMGYEVGREDHDTLRNAFSATVAIFCCLAGIVLVCGILLKSVILNILTIPVARFDVVNQVYWFVLFSLCIGAVGVPFGAIRQAHQHLISLAIYELASSIGALVILIALPFIAGDSLLNFVKGTFFLGFLLLTSKIIHAYITYPYAHPGLSRVNQLEVSRILFFSMWSLLSMACLQARRQVSILVINIQFGPIVNASYALANSTSNILMQASQMIHSSMQPAMTITHAKDEKGKLVRMISIGCRYTGLSSLPIFVPLMLEMPAFLELWLGKYPPGSPLFARLMMVAIVISLFLNGYGMSMNSVNRVRESITLGASVQLGFFGIAAFGVLAFNMPAWTIPVWSIAAMTSLVFLFPLLFGKSLGFTMRAWIMEVGLPAIVILLTGFLLGSVVILAIEPSLLRILLVTVSANVGLMISIWFLGVRREERMLFIGFLHKLRAVIKSFGN